MATKISASLQALSRELRYEPTTKRIRALLGQAVALDSRRAVIVWEPRRVVPCYAVPAEDVAATLSPATTTPADGASPPVLHPGIPFSRHSTPGAALDVSAGGQLAAGDAFRLNDPDLEGYVAFNSEAFDWLEEDDPVQSHPRDPFHRVDLRHSSRRVKVTAGDAVLAESAEPMMVFETNLPERIYVPPADVNWDLLTPTDSATLCPYKGTASYWKLAGGPDGDVAWSYQNPLPEAGELAGYVCFYDNLVDVEEIR
ncbi:hypothetical protein AL755_19705 [Arthrobacter sp. ERGS1:01]|uniref:DUF427 domain-containing protein n=1 Tax=Arthrobacter sp. ERGS1:01 TaxID=1704044 RepID=UPI0006B66EC1|nr:DUF427 domain-containing protein [Arthrobacter sp. ERGS1:01]ALE07182.1 hypothetical protein AL755_19705 [Arthrobacter sp. ERGS1:01]